RPVFNPVDIYVVAAVCRAVGIEAFGGAGHDGEDELVFVAIGSYQSIVYIRYIFSIKVELHYIGTPFARYYVKGVGHCMTRSVSAYGIGAERTVIVGFPIPYPLHQPVIVGVVHYIDLGEIAVACGCPECSTR